MAAGYRDKWWIWLAGGGGSRRGDGLQGVEKEGVVRRLSGAVFAL